jgi:leucyl-tRNA synthetase
VTAASWPQADRAALVQDAVELPVQINGKVRARVTVPAGATADDVIAAALADARVQAQLAGRPVRKQVLVPGRMVSLVV